jgi:adenylate cyclase
MREACTGRRRKLLNKAIELDPQMARAYTALGRIYTNRGESGWGPDEPAAWYKKAVTVLTKTVGLAPTDGSSHRALGIAYLDLSDFDRGFAEFDEAVVLNPNDPSILAAYAAWLPNVGRGEEAVDMINRAFRLNPHYPDWYNNILDPFYATGQYNEVVARARRKKGELLVWGQALLAMCYAQLGRQTDLAAAKTELFRRYPDFSMERALSDFGAFTDQPTLEHYLDGARKAGLDECATEAELQKYPKMTHLAYCDVKRKTN